MIFTQTPHSALEYSTLFQPHLIMSAAQNNTVINEGPFDPAIHLAPLPDKNAIGKIMMSDVGFPDSPLTKVRLCRLLVTLFPCADNSVPT